MAVCSVFNCDTSNDKKLKRNKNKVNEVPIKLFRFPKDLALAKVWQIKCGRKDKINVKSAFICSKHFTRDQYLRNLRHELLKYSPKCSKKLKADAIPTENLPLQSSSKKENIERSDRLERRRRHLEVEFLLKSPVAGEEELIESIIPDADNEDNEDNKRQIHLEPSMLDVTSVEDKNKISELEDKIKLLDSQVMSLMQENHQLKQECSAANAIFTPTQKKNLEKEMHE